MTSRDRNWLHGFLRLDRRQEIDGIPDADIRRQEDTVLRALERLDFENMGRETSARRAPPRRAHSAHSKATGSVESTHKPCVVRPHDKKLPEFGRG